MPLYFFEASPFRVHQRFEPVRLLRTANIRPALWLFISVPEQLDLIPDR
jgi:hypothetical protein